MTASVSDLRQLTTQLVVTKLLVSKATTSYSDLTEPTKLTLARSSLAVCRALEVAVLRERERNFTAGSVDFGQDYGIMAHAGDEAT